MLEGFVSGLFIAWILSLFGVDNMVIHSVKELFNTDISILTYYLSAGIVGLIGGAFNKN